MTGLALGSLAIGVLGVLAITGEYGSGTIRSSLAATPGGPLFLGAKAIVIGAVSLVVGEILTFACFFIGQGHPLRRRADGVARRPGRPAAPSCSPGPSWPCSGSSGWASG